MTPPTSAEEQRAERERRQREMDETIAALQARIDLVQRRIERQRRYGSR